MKNTALQVFEKLYLEKSVIYEFPLKIMEQFLTVCTDIDYKNTLWKVLRYKIFMIEKTFCNDTWQSVNIRYKFKFVQHWKSCNIFIVFDVFMDDQSCLLTDTYYLQIQKNVMDLVIKNARTCY